MKTTKKVAPDGGWGWVATFGVSLVNLATRSIEPSFGLLFGDLLAELNVGTTGAAVIMSALDVSMNFSGLFVGPLLKEFSYRKVAVAGSFLCGLGLCLTSPASSMPHILATYSVLNGIGVGLATSAAFVALNHYFKHKRGQAVGLSMAGTAMGMLIMPQLVRVLLEAFGFRGAVIMLAGVAFHAIVGSVLLQPAKWHMKEEEVDVELMPIPEMVTIKEDDEDSLPEMNNLLFNGKEKMRKNFSEVAMSTTNGLKHGIPQRPSFPRIMSNNVMLSVHDEALSNTEINNSIRRRKMSVMSNLSHLDFTGSTLHVHMNVGDEELEKHDQAIRRVSTHLGMSNLHRDSFIKMKPFLGRSESIVETVEEPTVKPGFWKRFADLMDVGLLKERSFLNLLFGLSIFYVAEMNFKMVTPFFFANLGYDKRDVAFCLSVTAITDIAARIVFPPIFDRFNIKKKLVFMISIVFVAITRSIMAEQTEWSQLMIWLSICGFFRGSALSNFTLTVSEYCSLEQLPSAFGWHLVGKAVFVTALGPVIGAIRDVTGSFPICIHAQSVCIFVCVIAWGIEYLLQYLKSKKPEAT